MYKMKENTVVHLLVFLLFFSLLFLGCDESIYVDSYIQQDHNIESFYPIKGVIGTEITIKGNNLQAVDTAKIGGEIVPIKYLISDTVMVIIANKDGISGKIELIDKFGKNAVSSDLFSYSNTSPLITSIPEKINSGDALVVKGTSLNAVIAVEVDNNSLEILFQNSTQLVVMVPFEVNGTYDLIIKYTSESTLNELIISNMHIERNYPAIINSSHLNVEIGDEVTLSGDFFNLVDSVSLDGIRMPIVSSSLNGKSLLFRVIDDMRLIDGRNSYVLSVHSGDSTVNFNDQFILNVSPFYLWKDLNMSCQSKGSSNYFVDFERGIVRNADGIGDIDYLTLEKNGNVCSAPNVSNVSLEEYVSINPYTMMLKQSSASIIYGPASGAWLSRYIKEIRPDFTGGARLFTGAPAFGTPIVYYRVLNNGDVYEKSIIDRIKTKQVDDLSLFDSSVLTNLDLTSNGNYTSDGWSNIPTYALPSYSPSSTSRPRPWALDAGVITNNITLNPGTVILCLYYSQAGFDSSKPADNVVKFGYMEIVNYVQDNSSGVLNGDGGNKNNIDMNIYWKRSQFF